MASPDKMGGSGERECCPGVLQPGFCLTLSGPLDLREVSAALWASVPYQQNEGEVGSLLTLNRQCMQPAQTK